MRRFTETRFIYFRNTRSLRFSFSSWPLPLILISDFDPRIQRSLTLKTQLPSFPLRSFLSSLFLNSVIKFCNFASSEAMCAFSERIDPGWSYPAFAEPKPAAEKLAARIFHPGARTKNVTDSKHAAENTPCVFQIFFCRGMFISVRSKFRAMPRILRQRHFRVLDQGLRPKIPIRFSPFFFFFFLYFYFARDG